ncbi:hypothetical protein ACTVBU_10705 [Sanguibacter sp. A246]|uniref:hypothetical protein n=1 Tax=Sanguibacter sp. A246 TaxID=3457326 RepID=UPI003FD860A1
MSASHARRLDPRELHLLRSACDTVEIARRLLDAVPAYPGAVETTRQGLTIVKDADGMTVGPERAFLAWSRVTEHARLLTAEERTELTDAVRALGALDHAYPVYLPDAIARGAGIRIDGNGVAAEDREAYRTLEAHWRAPALARFAERKAAIMVDVEAATAACLDRPGSRGSGGAPEEMALFDMGGLWDPPGPAHGPTATTVDGPFTAASGPDPGGFAWGPA